MEGTYIVWVHSMVRELCVPVRGGWRTRTRRFVVYNTISPPTNHSQMNEERSSWTPWPRKEDKHRKSEMRGEEVHEVVCRQRWYCRAVSLENDQAISDRGYQSGGRGVSSNELESLIKSRRAPLRTSPTNIIDQ